MAGTTKLLLAIGFSLSLVGAACGGGTDSGGLVDSGGQATGVASTATPDSAEQATENGGTEKAKADQQDPIGELEGGLVFDPLWKAEVILECGDTIDQRTIQSFVAETNGRGEPALYHSASGGSLFELEVGDAVTLFSDTPVSAQFAWSIPGILLGPWTADVVTDNCPPPPSTP